LALENGALSPTKEKSILIVVSFFLSFLGCGEGRKKARAASCRLNDCLAALLVLLFVRCDECTKEGLFAAVHF
jgi:hypothetical protein